MALFHSLPDATSKDKTVYIIVCVQGVTFIPLNF